MVLANIRLPDGSAEITGSVSRDYEDMPEGWTTSNRELVFRLRGSKHPAHIFSLPDAELGARANRLWLVRLERGADRYLVANVATADTSGGQVSFAEIFKLGPKHLKSIGDLSSNQSMRTVTRPGGGQVLVRSYEIGSDLFHAEMPRWEEIFDVEGGRLRQVTRHAGWFYKPWVRLPLEHLERAP